MFSSVALFGAGNPVSSLVLGTIQRRIGFIDQLGHGFTVFRITADAKAGRNI